MYNITGYLNIEPKLTDYDRFYLYNFQLTKHYKRDPELLNDILGGKNSYKGDYGEDGEYYIDHKANPYGDRYIPYQSISAPFKSNKIPPAKQPGFNCPWKPNKNGNKLIPSNNNKFNNNYGWLKWLIKNFFEKNNYTLNGSLNIKTINHNKLLSITDNKISIKIIKSEKLNGNNIKPKNNEIIDRLINLTKKGDIKWKLDNTSTIKKYISNIDLYDIDLHVNLFIRQPNTIKNYINIYLKNNFYKNIKTYKVNELIKNVEKEA